MFKLVFYLFLHFLSAEVSFRSENFLFHQEAGLAEQNANDLNSGNQVYKIPQLKNRLEIRPDLNWNLESSKIILRPAFSFNNTTTKTNLQTITDNEPHLDIHDFYLEHYVKENLKLSLGLQAFQWGPTEFINASNPFFHLNTDQRSFIFKEKGLVLLRLNLELENSKNLVLIINPVSNNTSEFLYEDHFKRQLLLKFEKAYANPSNYVGVVLNYREYTSHALGAYFNWSITDMFSVFADTRLDFNKSYYIPEAQGPWTNMILSENSERQSLLNFGVRYEENWDIRLEYIYNQAGYSAEQFEQIKNSALNILNPNISINSKRFFKNGLEMNFKNYIYLSVRKSEIFNFKDTQFYLRNLYSVLDSSSQVQLQIEHDLGDSSTLFAGYTVNLGKKKSEFSLLNNWNSTVGLRWVL